MKHGGDSDPKPSAFFLAPEAPYPLAGGGPLRTAGLLHYLARHYDVDLAVFREPASPDPEAHLPEGLVRRVWVLDLPHHSRAVAARVARNSIRLLRGRPPLTDRFAGFEGVLDSVLGARRYDLAVIDHFWCAPYQAALAPRADRVALNVHNVESVLHARCAAAERGSVAWAHRWFSRCARRLERRWLPRFDRVLAPSQADVDTLRGIAPGVRAGLYPNTIPWHTPVKRDAVDAIVFSGNMEYHPNSAAVRYFAGEIWPSLRSRWPSLNWLLIGKNPRAVVAYMERDARIRVVGAVDNAVEALALAKVAVVPLAAGSGTRFKILEAWAAGIPVVSTSVGAEGLPARDGEHLLIADDAVTFAAAVSRLLASPELRREIGAAGRALYERQFTWEAGWEHLEKLGL
ncbi:MAG: glycosyltransferase family 4 protein [Bryobacteraceae bacterium]